MPVSLETLDLSGGQSRPTSHKFTGGIPAEWSSMTNLKELKLSNCGLDGGYGLSRYTAQKRIEKPITDLFRTEFEAKLAKLQIRKRL